MLSPVGYRVLNYIFVSRPVDIKYFVDKAAPTLEYYDMRRYGRIRYGGPGCFCYQSNVSVIYYNFFRDMELGRARYYLLGIWLIRCVILDVQVDL